MSISGRGRFCVLPCGEVRRQREEDADGEEELHKHSLSQRGLNLGERAQADLLLEGTEEARTLA